PGYLAIVVDGEDHRAGAGNGHDAGFAAKATVQGVVAVVVYRQSVGVYHLVAYLFEKLRRTPDTQAGVTDISGLEMQPATAGIVHIFHERLFHPFLSHREVVPRATLSVADESSPAVAARELGLRSAGVDPQEQLSLHKLPLYGARCESLYVPFLERQEEDQ